MNAKEYYRNCARVALEVQLRWGIISHDVYWCGKKALGFPSWEELMADELPPVTERLDVAMRLAGEPGADLDKVEEALDYISACNPDGWCYGQPDTIVLDDKTYRIGKDDRSGLRDYASACGVADDGGRVYFRLHFLQADGMPEGVCVAWSVDD